jgi:hypothetical protein
VNVCGREGMLQLLTKGAFTVGECGLLPLLKADHGFGRTVIISHKSAL